MRLICDKYKQLMSNDWTCVSTDTVIVKGCTPFVYDNVIHDEFVALFANAKAVLRYYNSPYNYFNFVVVTWSGELIKYVYTLKK